MEKADEVITTLGKQLEGLDSCEENQRIAYAAGLSVDDNPVKPIFDQFLEARSEFQGMIDNGMKPDTREFKAHYDNLCELLQASDEAVTQLDQQLRVQLAKRRRTLLQEKVNQ